MNLHQNKTQRIMQVSRRLQVSWACVTGVR